MQAYALTDVGRVRTCNQDYLYSSSIPVGDLDNLLMVADGMGGHRAGDFASRFLVENLLTFFRQSHGSDPIALLRAGIHRVNGELYEKSVSSPELSGMGTTLVAATVKDNTLFVANVGDSRLYLFRNGELSQITRDHSFVEEMVALGQMTRGSKEYMEKKNIITRAVGTDWRVEVDFFKKELKRGDLLLLCSDGLTNMLSNDMIKNELSKKSPLKDKVIGLIASANKRGGRDNIAIVLADPQISEVGAC